ncbi:MAG: ATP synthase F0 subunit B [Acidobacteriota bacterium]|nr:ATP synthase F0 subunit B [Acidobacteriota bacterium]
MAFLYSFILIFAETGTNSQGGFMNWWRSNAEPVLNYPGFEAWKFFNLAVFIALMVYLLRKPLSAAFKAKRETIRAELIRAEEEKQSALAQLTATEARLARLDAEAADIRRKAEMEANAEKLRIAEQTEFEIKKLREQAQSEIERTSKLVRAELRRFSAEESIRLAEGKIKQQINPERDARLIAANIQSIGGLSR